jgi:hypothetical protein
MKMEGEKSVQGRGEIQVVCSHEIDCLGPLNNLLISALKLRTFVSLIMVCRLELCSTTDICSTRKLKTYSHRSSCCCVYSPWHIVEKRNPKHKRSQLSAPCFYCQFLCWCCPSSCRIHQVCSCSHVISTADIRMTLSESISAI